jgi:hypothetical protein
VRFADFGLLGAQRLGSAETVPQRRFGADAGLRVVFSFCRDSASHSQSAPPTVLGRAPVSVFVLLLVRPRAPVSFSCLLVLSACRHCLLLVVSSFFVAAGLGLASFLVCRFGPSPLKVSS